MDDCIQVAFQSVDELANLLQWKVGQRLEHHLYWLAYIQSFDLLLTKFTAVFLHKSRVRFISIPLFFQWFDLVAENSALGHYLDPTVWYFATLLSKLKLKPRKNTILYPDIKATTMIFELFIFYPFFVGVGNSHLSVNNLRFDQEASQNCYHHCYCIAWAYCYIAP